MAVARAESPDKIDAFDSLRGIAALVVVLVHVLLTFWPGFYYRTGPAWDDAPEWLRLVNRGTIKFLLNGDVAVSLFYVLSGFVLSIGFFRTGSVDVLVPSARRRYLRLMLPVAVSVFSAYFLMLAGAMRNVEAIRLMNDAYGFSVTNPDARPGWSNSWLAAYYQFEPSVGGALSNAVWGAFVRPCPYNWPLYTMPVELAGSFLVFASLALFGSTRNRWLIGLILAGACWLLGHPDLIFFIVGMAICDLCQRRDPSLSPTVATATIAASLVALRTAGGVAAAIVLAVVAFSPGLRRWLSLRPLVALGRMSFGFYVMHMPLMCSLGCGVYVVGRTRLEWTHTSAGLLACGVFLPTLFGVSWLFTRLVDEPTVALTRWLDGRLFREPANMAISATSTSPHRRAA